MHYVIRAQLYLPNVDVSQPLGTHSSYPISSRNLCNAKIILNHFQFQMSYSGTHLDKFSERFEDNQWGPHVLHIGHWRGQVSHLDLLWYVFRVLVRRHHESRRTHGEADVLEAVVARDIQDVVDHGRDVIVAGLIPTERTKGLR